MKDLQSSSAEASTPDLDGMYRCARSSSVDRAVRNEATGIDTIAASQDELYEERIARRLLRVVRPARCGTASATIVLQSLLLWHE